MHSIRYDQLFLAFLFGVFLATTIWVFIHVRARRYWTTLHAIAKAEVQQRSDAMRYCPACKSRYKKLSES